jgi:hypothetical protein
MWAEATAASKAVAAAGADALVVAAATMPGRRWDSAATSLTPDGEPLIEAQDADALWPSEATAGAPVSVQPAASKLDGIVRPLP